MKLAKIEHWRCDEPIRWCGGDGNTYVWVPDDMTPEQFDVLCGQARKAYLDTEQYMKGLAPVRSPGHGAIIDTSTPDSTTVGELRAAYTLAEKAYKEYQAMVEKARKGFAHHLQRCAEGRILMFWEEDPEISAKLSWGHNHGMTIDHSPTRTADYPFPESDEEEL